jgi:hypothetical protein
MFAKPRLCPIFLSLVVSSITFSMYNPKDKPSPYQYNYPSKNTDYVYNSSSEHQYKPKGIYGNKNNLDPILVDQLINNAPTRVQLFVRGLRRRDESPLNTRLKRMLLFGVPGNGKTSLAKAIALKTFGQYYFIRSSDMLDSWKNCQQNLRAEIDFLITKINGPIIVIYDEVDQITNQYKDRNSSDKGMPAAFWSLLDYCAEELPDLCFICTTNNESNDFPDPLISRFGRNMICIPNPDLQLRKQLIYYYLDKIKHNLTEQDIHDFAQRLDRRSCRDIRGIIDDAFLFLPEDEIIVTLEEIRSAEEENPYELSKHQRLARRLNITEDALKELMIDKALFEEYREIMDYTHKERDYNLQRASFNQTADHHEISLAQSERHHDLSLNQTQTHHNASIAQSDQHFITSFNQIDRNHNASIAQANNSHLASLNQAQQHHINSSNQTQANHFTNLNQSQAHHIANLNQSQAHHTANLNQSQAHHTSSINQAQMHHTASLNQSQAQHDNTNRRQDADTVIDGVSSGLTGMAAGFAMGGIPGATLGGAAMAAPSLAKVYFRNR